MADLKIIDLPALSVQSGTDLKEVSTNGTGSYKESRAQELVYINSNAQITEIQVTNLTTDLASKLNLSGGTMTGFLTLNANPVTNLEAATKQYVDGIGAAVTFQQTYNNSGGSPSFTVGSGGFSIKDSSANNLFLIEPQMVGYSMLLASQQGISLANITNGGFSQFNGDSSLNYLPVDKLAGNPNYTFTAQSIIPSNTFATAGNYSFGFSDESSSPSGFFNISLTNSGTLNSLFYATGTTTGKIPRVGINAQLLVGVPYGNPSNQNAAAQINSTTQGFLPPVLSSTQESTLTALLGSGDSGLSWYNSTTDVPTYWDGFDKQQLLAVDNIIQGSNMTITNHGDGTVTFSSSGGGSTTTQVQGSFNFLSTTLNTVTGSDTPINCASGTFNAVNPVGTNVTTATVSGVTTAIIQNTSTGGRWCSINYDLTMYIPSGSGQIYNFTVYTNTGAVAFFQRYVFPGGAPTYVPINICAPMVFLNTNDYVYLAVSGSGSSLNFNTQYFNGRLLDTTISSVASTNGIVTSTAVTTNSNFYPTFVSSSSGSNQSLDTSSGFSINPFTNILTIAGINVSGLNTSQAVVTDASRNLTSLSYGSGSVGLSLVQRDSSGNFSAAVASFSGVKISGISASQAVVTDGSNNLASLFYGSTTVANSLVERDGSGNFSAGIITASLSGNATTSTTATNATNVATTQVSSNASYYPLMAASSTNSNQASDLATGLTYNPSTNILSTTGLNLSGLTASVLVAADSSKNLTSVGAGTTTTVLHGNASGIPTYSAVSLVNDITGTLGIGNGGLGFTTATTGDLFLATATNTPGKLAAVAGGSVLASVGTSTAPAWQSSPTLTGLTLSGLTSGSILFAGASGVLSQDNANFFYDATNHRTYLGSTSATSFQSPTRLNMYGVAGGTGSINFYTNTDLYPTMQLLNYDHNNIMLSFDAYWNGSNWTSGYTGSNFQLNKSGAVLAFNCASITQGSTISSWTTGMQLGTSGAVSVPAGGGSTTTLTIGGSAANLTTTTPAVNISSAYGAGNYISFGGSGRSIGLVGGSPGSLFISRNLNISNTSYIYASTNVGCALELSGPGAAVVPGGFRFRTTPSGTSGTTATMTDMLTISNTGMMGLNTASNGQRGSVTLSGATTTVNTTAAVTGCYIGLSNTSVGGTAGFYTISITNATSFTITSSAGVLDTSTLQWFIMS